jgi:hypothetical protein
MAAMYERKVKAQFKRWASTLLKVNSDYVTDPGKLVSYVRGPNWDYPDPNFAHYRNTVKFYGDELLSEFERLRECDIDTGVARYRELLARCGFDPETRRFD